MKISLDSNLEEKQSLINFAKIYYDGEVTTEDLLYNEEVSIDDLHTIRKYYDLTDDELSIYFTRCNIDNSEFVHNSTNVRGSYGIAESNYIWNSRYIRVSAHIENSSYIYYSDDVRASSDVFFSNGIDASNLIVNSSQVKGSKQVLDSKKITNSCVVLGSQQIKNSRNVAYSQNCDEVMFSNFLTNCTHCLFCYGLQDTDYMIFNQPVTPVEYEEAKAKLEALLEKEEINFVTIQNEMKNTLHNVEIDRRLSAMINGLSADFFGAIGSFDKYNDTVFFTLFFDKENLK